jgi:hypothetical protein
MEEKGAQLQVESRSRKFAGIAVFLRAALDRAATVTQVWCTWRFAQDKFKVAEYSPRWSLLDIVSNICTVRLRWDLSCTISLG